VQEAFECTDQQPPVAVLAVFGLKPGHHHGMLPGPTGGDVLQSQGTEAGVRVGSFQGRPMGEGGYGWDVSILLMTAGCSGPWLGNAKHVNHRQNEWQPLTKAVADFGAALLSLGAPALG
jgi:hypothetical protein